ncbi:MAG: hypothetical protein CMN72_16020 [Sphingomonas sp.]|nr:hypothetical protein [Sphingomonas sp.]
MDLVIGDNEVHDFVTNLVMGDNKRILIRERFDALNLLFRLIVVQKNAYVIFHGRRIAVAKNFKVRV